MNPVILVVDDESSIRKLLRVRLTREGYSVQEAEDGEDALKQMEVYSPQAIISDIRMPNLDGFQLIEKLKQKDENSPSVILITGHGDKEAAIKAVRSGAYDYLEKPFDLDQVVATTKRAIEATELKIKNAALLTQLERANKGLNNQLDQKEEELSKFGIKFQDSDQLIGKSKAMEKVKNLISKISPEGVAAHEDTTTILVTGESGTGKEVAARMIHDFSARADGPFIAVNCAAFSESLLESELFGHEKGSFTGANEKKIGLFEAANEGTIFLDEIGEADPKTQASLLRVLQEKCIRRVGGTKPISVNVRVVSATNRELENEVKSGNFREDLFYRLNVIHVHLPPLRERGDDVFQLAEHFLEKVALIRKSNVSGFDEEAKQAILGSKWPGNVRQLQNSIERAVILAKGHAICLEDLGLNSVVTFPGRNSENSSTTGAASLDVQELANAFFEKVQLGIPYRDFSENLFEEVECQLLKMLLESDSGNVSQVARKLGLDRSNVQRRLKRWSINPGVYRKAA